MIQEKTTNYTTNRNSRIVRFISLVVSILLLGSVILGPTGLIKGSSTSSSGIDCIWLLDVSASMDVMDVTEGTNATSRLVKAKSVIENYIISHPENRYGLVIFAGTSRLVSPLTMEHSSILTFLSSIDSKSIQEGGTDFLEAIKLAIERFETKDQSPHVIVLVSDGGDKEDSPDMAFIRNVFQGKHTTLTSIGIGETKPSFIPTGRTPLGDIIYKKFNGEVVLSGLNKESLKNLAKAGNGVYLDGTSIEKDLEKSLSTISRHIFSSSGDMSTDTTVQVLMLISFFFFLVFLLFPSSFLKSGNAL